MPLAARLAAAAMGIVLCSGRMQGAISRLHSLGNPISCRRSRTGGRWEEGDEMTAKQFGRGMGALGVCLSVMAVLWAGLAPTPVAGHDEDDRWGRNVESATQKTPETEDIPPRGLAWNFRLMGHNPLLDSDQGTSNFDPYINPPMGIPRGSNGDITAAGDCAYVGSLIGYQPALIVDVSNPPRPTVVGAVPDLVPGVRNGIEGLTGALWRPCRLLGTAFS